MGIGLWDLVFAGATVGLMFLHPNLGLNAIRKTLGLALFLQLFYVIGSYLGGWPFPHPGTFLQLLIVSGLGISLGAIFSKVWPLPPNKGIERVARTLLLTIPALGLGIGLQVLLQGSSPTQALYLIFSLASWLGSGANVRVPELNGQGKACRN